MPAKPSPSSKPPARHIAGIIGPYRKTEKRVGVKTR
jgi:hypothetical protein